MKVRNLIAVLLTLAAAPLLFAESILNVSYDPTRELYRDINASFSMHWAKKTGHPVDVRMSHGGSGKQARAVLDGIPADVVTLALGYDVDAIARAGLLSTSWQNRFPYRSCPFTSTIVFVVRNGNPKQIRDWPDLVKPGVAVITPNPKTSGGARWNYLAAWGFAKKTYGSDAKALEFMRALFANVPVLDTGARGSTTTFVERGIGDVYIAWENEALLVTRDVAPGRFEMIVPSVSIVAETPVAIVDSVVNARKTRAIAEAYVGFLYSPVGQSIASRHYFRPRYGKALVRAGWFKRVNVFTVEDMFGGWSAAHQRHFRDGGTFDQITAARR
jgi:sulfate transport system substrate-binding protein